MSKRMGVAAAAVLGMTVGFAWAQPAKKPMAEPRTGKPLQPAAAPKRAAAPTLVTPGQAEKKAEQPAEEMRDRMSSETGPEHSRLAKLAGEFTSETAMSMPGQEPMKTTGAATLRMILGGRFLQMDESGSMGGQPFQAVKIWGYNNAAARYEATWMWTNETSMMTMAGKPAEDGKSVTLDASYENGGPKVTLRVTLAFVDDDHFTVKLDAGKMPDGSRGPTLETVYTRKR